MVWFSKKEDTRYIAEFDGALAEINALAKAFRNLHFDSVSAFEKNFEKAKSAYDIQKERALFEEHLDVLQKLKLHCDALIDEAFKIVRNETALTEKDRQELGKLRQAHKNTGIKVGKR